MSAALFAVYTQTTRRCPFLLSAAKFCKTHTDCAVTRQVNCEGLRLTLHKGGSRRRDFADAVQRLNCPHGQARVVPLATRCLQGVFAGSQACSTLFSRSALKLGLPANNSFM